MLQARPPIVRVELSQVLILIHILGRDVYVVFVTAAANAQEDRQNGDENQSIDPESRPDRLELLVDHFKNQII